MENKRKIAGGIGSLAALGLLWWLSTKTQISWIEILGFAMLVGAVVAGIAALILSQF